MAKLNNQGKKKNNCHTKRRDPKTAWPWKCRNLHVRTMTQGNGLDCYFWWPFSADDSVTVSYRIQFVGYIIEKFIFRLFFRFPPNMPGFTCVYNGANGKSIDPKHLCSSCEKVLRDPVQTSCGHRYCKTCVEPLSRYCIKKLLFKSTEKFSLSCPDARNYNFIMTSYYAW